MSRILWLKAERTSESDTIVHPATADQVALALEFLEGVSQERQETACRLQTLLTPQRITPPESRRAIPCRRPQGLFVLLPWSLAAWLVWVMESPVEIVNEVQRRLACWLAGQSEAKTGGEEKKHTVAQPSRLR